MNRMEIASCLKRSSSYRQSFEPRTERSHCSLDKNFRKLKPILQMPMEGRSRDRVEASEVSDLHGAESILTALNDRSRQELEGADEVHLSSANIGDISLGIGEHVLGTYENSVRSAQSEVIIVTCFWAKSRSQEQLCASLVALADRAIAEGRLVLVKLCFSSLSLWQKLTHTRSLDGQMYDPRTWISKFGLPDEGTLLKEGPAGSIGVDLSVKSIFVAPFSVMHPKFFIIDRKEVLLPSCNVSWENWFEGGLKMTGAIVSDFIRFYLRYWDLNELQRATNRPTSGSSASQDGDCSGAIPAMLLPSPHRAWPNFRPFLSAPAPPSTPLNNFLLTVFKKATSSLYLQTPNLTSPPVLSTLTSALSRGVDISIVTSTKMMILEQIATAGTVTELCVRKLVRQYNNLIRTHERWLQRPGAIEEGRPTPGKLSVHYYQPGPEAGEHEPVKSHFKLTIIDQHIVVLGSGNMDRASWYTSQELGVAFFSTKMARNVRSALQKELEGRLGPELVQTNMDPA